MAITQNTYTGDGSTVLFSFTFEYIAESDIKITLDGTPTTAYTLANATTVQFDTAPANGVAIRIYRQTDDSVLSATFYPGSAIRSQDLNNNFTQNLYVTQEVNNNAVDIDGSNPMVGNLDMGGYRVINNGVPIDDADAATKKYVDDRTGNVTIPGHTYWRYVAAGGETTLTGPGTGTGILQYSSTREQVFINGALQQRNVDYTADDGLTIELLSGALIAGDVVDVRCVNNLASGNTGLADDITYANQFTGQVSRSVASKLSDVVSVLDFGAVGDGVTDDTAAIQAAENYASANKKAVRFPAGIYLCGSTLYRKGNTDWIGDGATASIVKHSGGSSTHDMVNLLDSTTEYSNIGFYNLGFDGNRTGSTSDSIARNAILFDRSVALSKNIRLIGCRITNTSYGGMMFHVKGYTGVEVKDCDIRDGGGGLYHPIYIRRCADVVVTGNRLQGRDGNACIKVQNSPDSSVTANVCNGGGRGIHAQDADGISIVGNSIYDSTSEGIEASIEDNSATSRVSIVGNVIHSAVSGLGLSNLTVFTVSGNTLFGFSVNGIKCRACRDGAITGNTFSTASTDVGTVNYIFFEAGPVTNRSLVSSNWLRNDRTVGTTKGIVTDETTTSGLVCTLNTFSNTGWNPKYEGLTPLIEGDPSFGLVVGAANRARTNSFQEIHTTVNVAASPSYSAYNWRAGNVGPAVDLLKSRSGVIGTNGGSVIASDPLALFRGFGDHEGQWLRGGQIIIDVETSPTAGVVEMPGRITFATTPTGSSTPAKRYRVTSNGQHLFGSKAITTPEASAELQIDSTTRGFMPPRMTTAQRDAISNPAVGLVIFNTTTNKLNVRGTSAWEAVTSV